MPGWFIIGFPREKNSPTRLCQSFFALQSINPFHGEDASYYFAPENYNDGSCETGAILLGRGAMNRIHLAGQAMSGHMYCQLNLQ